MRLLAVSGTVDSPCKLAGNHSCCWFPDLEKVQQLPKLGLIHSIAAGVEHLNLNAVRPDQAVCRVPGPHHQKGMFDLSALGVYCILQRYFRPHDPAAKSAALEAVSPEL